MGDWFAIKWMPSDKYTERDRINIENQIRSRKKLPCGKR